MKKSLKRGLALGAAVLGASALAASTEIVNPRNIRIESDSEIEALVRDNAPRLKSGAYELKLPIFDNLPAAMCSMYARLSAEHLSGTLYNPSHAWSFAKANSDDCSIDELSSWKEFYDLGKVGKINPGQTIVIFYNTLSLYNRSDRPGTHAGIPLGIDDNGEYVCGHEYGSDQIRETVTQLHKRGLIPVQLVNKK